MSQVEEDDSKPWTEHDLKEAIRRINAGEINLKDAESYYGISPRTIHRQRAIENMRAQLNPEKGKKVKSAGPSAPKKDITILRKPVEISCSSVGHMVSLFSEGTQEVKQLLNHECDLIYECKVCKSLFRSLLNFISHKRIYCCDMYSVVHTQSSENGDSSVATDPSKVEENLKAKENLKEFASRPLRITCRKDLTTVLKRITSLSSEFVSAEPILHLQSLENTTCALQQTIKSSQFINESIAKSPNSNSKDDNSRVELPVETKKENSTKSRERSSVVVKPVTIVAEKRFKCPLCPSHYTTKKSVLRHLKTVHHKSVEQLERLKPRIQLFFVKKKNVLVTKKKKQLPSSKQSVVAKSTSIPSGVVSNESAVLSTSSAKSDQNLDQDQERECSFCGRKFVNRNSYASHTRICRKSASMDKDTDSINAAASPPLVPIVSLTPVSAPEKVSQNENNNSCITRKLASSAHHSKKIGLSLGASSSSSSSKRIGIQVRMNYCKDGVNQSGGISGTPIGYTAPSDLSVASVDNLRRSSSGSVTLDEKSNVTKTDLLNGHNTRSKLAHILKSLIDKRDIKDENEDPKKRTLMKKVEKSEVSIFCEDCKTAYALNDHKWNSENGICRNYRCALKGCDFRSSSKSELLPHLSARHPVLSENELAEVNSIFIAESSGILLNSGKCSCHKVTSREKSLERPKRDLTENSRVISSQNTVSSKRKLPTDSADKPAKRKDFSGEKRKRALPAVGVKSENTTATSMQTGTKKSKVSKNEGFNSDKKVKDNQLLKKKNMKNDDNKPTRVKAKKQALVSAILPNVIPNGLESSGDEQSQFPATKTARKQSLSSVETKLTSKLPKINTIMDAAPFSLTSDSDLDPATMTDENLKKSVMTIIFGKDVSDENVDANIIDSREKSPVSSSASSDSGKEKRYGLRAGKPICSTSNKTAVPSSMHENEDDLILKVQIVNKMKNTTR